jgi:hypothetical protein
MAHTRTNYFRLHRRRLGFTQAELAYLFGYQSDSVISRLEQHERAVALAVGFACQTVFGHELHEIYPGLHEQVVEQVTGRMRELYQKLEQKRPTKRTIAKLRALSDALARFNETTEQIIV